MAILLQRIIVFLITDWFILDIWVGSRTLLSILDVLCLGSSCSWSWHGAEIEENVTKNVNGAGENETEWSPSHIEK